MSRVRHFALLALLVCWIASCAPKATPAPTLAPSPKPATPTATAVPHASEIRFALIGNVTPINVWALFDAKGYSYNNYAVMSGYYPRLYQLSIPDHFFEVMAASEMPSPVRPEGNFFTATAPLHTDLKWTDGTPFTADDVAFTVNTALSFQLGFDWHDFYNPDYLDHAQALDAHTVKFFFKKQPNVGVWQYGALQGPIVQKAYWESKVSASAALLPPADLPVQVASLTAQAADLQAQIDALNATLAKLPPNGTTYIETTNDVKSLTGTLNQTNTAIIKIQSQYDSALESAQKSLYALDYKNEPTLGDWMPAGQQNGAWVNKVNPAHPFNTPKFDSAVYKIYANEADALNVIRSNDADVYLSNNGGPPDIYAPPPMVWSWNSTRLITFLAINDTRPHLADIAFHQMLGCLLNRTFLAITVSLNSFIPSGESFWSNSKAILPCSGMNDDERTQQAFRILKTAGYTWDKEPLSNNPGNGIKSPNGEYMQPITLLLEDVNQAAFGLVLDSDVLEKAMNYLGIRIDLQATHAQSVNYSVFSSHQYDIALLSWRVSEYPAYLCDWFKDGNPFGYHSDRLQSACAALNSTSDLAAARQDVDQIQSILAQDLPFIPLYSTVTYDAYRNIKYPFDSVVGGLSGVYGAPSLAIPAP